MLTDLERLRAWLTLDEAAAVLNRGTKRETKKTDLVRLGIQGHLKLTLRTTSHWYCTQWSLVRDPNDLEGFEVGEWRLLRTPGGKVFKRKWKLSEGEVFELEPGCWMLPMIHNVTDELERLCGLELSFPDSTLLRADGIFLTTERQELFEILRNDWEHGPAQLDAEQVYLSRYDFPESSEVGVCVPDLETFMRTLEAQVHSQPETSSVRWPWGSYETKLLRALAEAAERFWANYDPEDRTTAVSKKNIVDWLKNEHGCTPNMATAIDTILRADGAPGKARRGLNPRK